MPARMEAGNSTLQNLPTPDMFAFSRFVLFGLPADNARVAPGSQPGTGKHPHPLPVNRHVARPMLVEHILNTRKTLLQGNGDNNGLRGKKIERKNWFVGNFDAGNKTISGRG